MFMLTSCDQNIDQHNTTLQPNDNTAIATRGDCDDCPGANECCCVIEWLSGDLGIFMLCGTSDGDAAACEIDPSPCENDIDGLQHSSFTLSSGTPIHYFCVNENTDFQVYRFGIPTGTTNFRINCRRDQTNPNWVLESFTDEDRICYDVDENCDLESP
jgi:hypothetical protein